MAVDILIPSFNNREYLEPCLASIKRWTYGPAYHVWVINNGALGTCKWAEALGVNVLESGANLGWTGALALGLDHSDCEHVCFLNDDTLIPPSSRHWLATMLRHFDTERVGAVGPATNVCIGSQSIFDNAAPLTATVPYLVGFCLLLSRSVLDDVGGVDASLPGGDDMDLSIRLRKNNFLLLADKRVFIYHHGFVTGQKVYGRPTAPGGWNSPQYGRMVHDALLRKHGHDGLRLIGWE